MDMNEQTAGVQETVQAPVPDNVGMPSTQQQGAAPQDVGNDVQGEQVQTQDVDYALDDEGNLQLSDSFFNAMLGDDPNSMPQEDAQGQVPTPPQTQQEQPPAPQMVTVRVDGQDVQIPLEEAARGYSRQADYTRKTQQLAEQRRQFEQERANFYAQVQQSQIPQQPPQPQMSPEEQRAKMQEQQRQYVDDLDAYAKQQVESTYGEDFDQYNPKHMAAYVDAVGNVKAVMVEQANSQREQMEAKQRAQQNIAMVAQKYQQDPNFNAINVLAKQQLENLPYREYKRVTSAIERGDAQTVDQYMGAIQRMYYSQNNPTPPQQQPTPRPAQPIQQPRPRVNPPYVEKAGNTAMPQGQNAPQWGKIGRLTTDQQAALVRQYAGGIGL